MVNAISQGFLFLFLFLQIVLRWTAVHAGRNLYEVLGVPKGCSEGDLKKAYRRQCLQHHPDKGGKEESFKDIQKAYEILSDKNKRQVYDQYGEDAASASVPPQPGQMPNFFSFQSSATNTNSNGPGGIFGDVNIEELLRGGMAGMAGMGTAGFQRGGSHSNLDFSELLRQMGQNPQTQHNKKPKPMAPLTQTCPCSLEELATGATKKLKVKLPTGRSKIYTIALRKGWKAGTKIKFDAAGATFPPMTFVLQEKKHALFQRRGDDLLYRYNLPPTSANSNYVTIDLVLPTGESWSKTLPSSSSFLRHGQSLTITDKGMPIKGGPQRGNLIIEFYQQYHPHDNKQEYEHTTRGQPYEEYRPRTKQTYS
jgi:DnaJ-class molecular chaperone